MSDIATLGIAIDSRSTVAATKALDDFARSAKPATAGASALEKATAGAGKSAGALGTGLKPTVGDLLLFQSGAKTAAVNTTVLEKAITDAGKASVGFGGKLKPAGDALAGVTRNGALARHELINLSRQVQDIGVSLVGGMSPFTVLAQQGSQVFDIFSSSKTATVGGAIKQIGSGIASVLTPARLAVGGVLALGAAGLYTANALGQSALAAANLAKATGTSIGDVRGLQTAASLKGIGAEESSKAMAQFARNVYDARNNMGGLVEVFRANNIQARDFNGYLDGASTLIRRAKGDTQLQFSLLQSMGLPATEKWVKLLEQGGDALRRAINANQGNPDAENKLAAAAQKFDDAWNSATTKASQYIKSWALSAWSALDSVAQKVADGVGSFTRALAGQAESERAPIRVRITGGTTLPPDAKPVDPAVVQRALSLEQQRLGLLGQVATVNETVRAQEIAIAQARLNGVNVSAADSKRILDNARANALGTAQIRAQTDAYALEAATLGMTAGQAAAYAAVQDRINEAKRRGSPLTAEQIAALRTEAAALGDAVQRAENMRAGYDALTNSGQTFLSTLRNGGSVWDGFKSAGVSALDTISSKLMKMATDQLWTSAFGGSSGGGLFNGLGSLFGGAAPTMGAGGLAAIHHTGYGPGDRISAMRAVPASTFTVAPRFHTGIGPGERAAVIRDDESVLTPGQMRALAPVGAGGGAISVNIPINIDATGADPAGLHRVEQKLAQLKAELPARAVAALKSARSKRDF